MSKIFQGIGPSWEYPDQEPIDLDLGQKTGVNIGWSEDILKLSRPFTFRLNSECVAAATYQPVFQTLFLEFTDGTAYEYSGITPWMALDLIQSSSVGRYFNYEIRGQYPFEKLYWR